MNDEYAAAVGAETEEGRLTEGQQAGVAEQQVAAQREQSVDDDVGRQRLVRRDEAQRREGDNGERHAISRRFSNQALVGADAAIDVTAR